MVKGLSYQASAMGIALIAAGIVFLTPKQEDKSVVHTKTIRSENWSLVPLVENNALVGVELSIESRLAEEWTRYAPVHISIPELKYIAPLPVQDYVRTARSSFGPQPPGTYTYQVVGKDGTVLLQQKFP